MFHDWFLTTSDIRLQRLSYYECDSLMVVLMYIQSLKTVIVRSQLLVT